jgi:hypothetical protein
MKKHICVFFAFQNFEHIKLSFESIYIDGIDFFIIENSSSSSNEIKQYFISNNNKLKGYIQFEENIAANAINIFLRDFTPLLKEYEYITITDGDLYLYNSHSFFEEILHNLNFPNVMVSSGDLFLDNLYILPNPIIGIENYNEKCKLRNLPYEPIYKNTGNNLLTFRSIDLDHIKSVYYLDINIYKKVKELNKQWAHTNKNVAYHLTWDLYREGEKYYTWKKSIINKVWKITKECKYITIV